MNQDHPLRRLRTAWREAQRGQGQLVALIGEAGSGRSRLIAELGETIDGQAPHALWLVAQARPDATYIAYTLLAELLAPWGGAEPAGAVPELITALDALALGADQDERDALARSIHELERQPGAGRVDAALLGTALAPALRRAAYGQPVILVLEDLEWADAASLAVLNAMLPPLLVSTALVLCTHHADWSHQWRGITRYYQLLIGPLTRAESQIVLEQVAGEPVLPPEVSDALSAASQGNPLFLEQAGLAAQEQLAMRPGVAPELAATALRSLEEVLLARFQLLTEAERQVLVAAAAVGQRCSLMDVEARAGPRVDVRAALEGLVQRRLLHRWRTHPQLTYRFAHGLIHEIAHSALAATQHEPREQPATGEVAGPKDVPFVVAVPQPQASTRDVGPTAPLPSPSEVPAEAPGAVVSGRQDAPRSATLPAPSEPPRGEVRDEDATAPVAALTPLAPEPITGPLPAPSGGTEEAELFSASRTTARLAALTSRALDSLLPIQRASVVLCLHHGYSYAAAALALGLSPEAVRNHVATARQTFLHLYASDGLESGQRLNGATADREL